jgi:hypothetical protein
MIYKFKSKASGDLVMLEASGDQLLRLLGREPARQGIFEVDAMPALLQRLEQALAEPAAAGQPTAAGVAAAEAAAEAAPEHEVGLRQRLWPMIEMLRRCHAAREPIVWGV